MTERFIEHLRLVDAFARDGCPVCRCLVDDSRRHLETLMYEHVTDAETRRALRASMGFCNWHTWMLRTMPSFGFGAAIIHEDLLNRLVERVSHEGRPRATAPSPGLLARALIRRRRCRLVERYLGRSTCPVCARTAEGQRRYLRAILAHVEDSEFDRAYAISQGLCAPHLMAALEIERTSPTLDRLLERTLACWRALLGDLGGFLAKHDYRRREEFTEAEAASLARVFETLAGAAGVFGNDVRASSASAHDEGGR